MVFLKMMTRIDIENPEDKTPAPAQRDESIANELVRARKVLGWTQNELHLRTGISRETIKQYETGRHLPGAREMRLLCKTLGISGNRILFGTDDFDMQPSLLQGLLSDAQANEAQKVLRFMTLYNMLTSAERNALLVIIESIIVSRKGDREIRQAFAALDVLNEHIAPEITDMAEAMEKKFTKKKAAEMSKEIRAKVKETK